MRLISIVSSIVLFVCCSKKSDLDAVLEFSGANRIELEKTIEHYTTISPDSLKLKAAYFLIENMITQYSFDSPFYNDYSMTQGKKFKEKEHIIDSLIFRHRNDFNRKIYDCQVITSDLLIENIELAFKVWQEKPWSQSIDFDTFCEYILPYKVGNEPVESWRKQVLEEYEEALDSLVTSTSIYEVATTLNMIIQKKDFHFSSQLQDAPDLGFMLLSKNFMGYCKNSTDYVTYCMRALGIPAGIDFVKQWGNRSASHTWNFVLDEKGKTWPFDGYYTNLGVEYIHREYSKKAKVFRHSYKLSKINLHNTKEPLADSFFIDKNIKDVSKIYWDNPPIKIDIPLNAKNKTAYLCVFNNHEWIPVQFSKTIHNQFVFEDMEHDVVFLPCFLDKGNPIPFSHPIFLQKNGTIENLIPEKNSLTTVYLHRKYPLNLFQTNAARIVRGTFEGTNDIDFQQVDRLGIIEKINDDQLYNSIQVKSNKKYRFVRYKGAIQSYGSIAELKFYSGSELLNGKIIGSNPHSAENKNSPEMAFDDNNLTYYAGPRDSAWVGLDLGMPQAISEIIFAPRNDDNHIKPNNTYELFYHDDKKWNSLGKQQAIETALEYNNVPQNALLWLRNHTEGKEERIFTHKDNKITWW